MTPECELMILNYIKERLIHINLPFYDIKVSHTRNVRFLSMVDDHMVNMLDITNTLDGRNIWSIWIIKTDDFYIMFSNNHDRESYKAKFDLCDEESFDDAIARMSDVIRIVDVKIKAKNAIQIEKNYKNQSRKTLRR